MKQQVTEFKRNKVLHFPVKYRVNLQNSFLQNAASDRNLKNQTAEFMEGELSEQN